MRTLDYVKTQCTERGWGICAIMSRQEDLLQKLAARWDASALHDREMCHASSPESL